MEGEWKVKVYVSNLHKRLYEQGCIVFIFCPEALLLKK